MKIVEAPRDALQGAQNAISTDDKVRYINALLRVGFDTIDVGSFVSHKQVPQLADTALVIEQLNLSGSQTKLQTFVVNARGVDEAVAFPQINTIAFPFTSSPTFARINTNTTVPELHNRMDEIANLCAQNNKELVVYYSMAFGNPYGDNWSVETLAEWLYKIEQLGVSTVHLADTTAESDPNKIELLFSNLIPAFPNIEFGLHLHTEPHTYQDKVHAAYTSGCRRFDSVLNGYGGHPVLDKMTVGNLRTGSLIAYLERMGEHLDINRMAFLDALYVSNEIFPRPEAKLVQ
jgi:hydroxymethylglutaryl-CoA lyase